MCKDERVNNAKDEQVSIVKDGHGAIVKDERGYIVVETVGVFTLFVFLIASILALVGIVALQARVHSAITQTAQTLSMYSYIFEVTGTSNQFVGSKAQTSMNRASVADLKTGLSKFPIGNSGNQGQVTLDAGSDLFSDPSKLITLFLDEGKKAAFTELAIRPLVGRYLRNGTMSGDQYLKYSGVKNGLNSLEFKTDGVLIDKNGGITITVGYDVAYSFWGLPLPFSKLHMTQSAKTRAWLGGEGVRYTG